MTIKVTNCKNCIFRESHFDPNSVGYDTVDTCLLLRKTTNYQESFIVKYDSWDEVNEPKELKYRKPNCPLDKEQIIISL